MTKPLNRSEQIDAAVAAKKLVEQGAKASKHGKVFMPNVVLDKKAISPAIWKALSHFDKAHCILVNLHAEIICDCPKRGPKHMDKAKMQKMIALKQQEKAKAKNSALGAVAWNSSMVRPASDYAITGRWGDSNPISAENLSKLVFCFQHYALNSKVNAVQSDLNYPTLIAGGADYPERNGILDAQTRQMLEYLWSSNFQRVSQSAAPLSPMGKLFGAAIMANATWPSLIALIAQQYPPRTLPASEKFADVLLKHPQTNAMYSSNRIGIDQNPLALLSVDANSISNVDVKQLVQILQLSHQITQQASSQRNNRSTSAPSVSTQQAVSQLQQENQARAEQQRREQQEQQERDARARRVRDMASRGASFGDY